MTTPTPVRNSPTYHDGETVPEIPLPAPSGSGFVPAHVPDPITGSGSARLRALDEPVDIPFDFGPFRLETLLGSGGQAVVFRAIQLALERPVALKVLTPRTARDPEFVERFHREGRLAARVGHQNLVRVYQTGTFGDWHWLAMELVAGEDLLGLLRREGRLDPRRALSITRAVAQAMHHAAQEGILHRDIKPQNILIDADGTPKLADLGMAKDAGGKSEDLTATGIVIGTPYYMSPEACLGTEALDVRSDIYSLGIVLFQMLTGQLPLRADSHVATMMRHTQEDVPNPTSMRGELSPRIDRLVASMTARHRDFRFADAAELAAAIDALLSSKTARLTRQARGSSQRLRPGRASSRRTAGERPAAPPAAARSGALRVAMVASTALLLALAGGLAATLLGGGAPKRAGSPPPAAAIERPAGPTAAPGPPPTAESPRAFSIAEAQASALLAAAIDGEPRELLTVQEQHGDALERAFGADTVALLATIARQRLWLAGLVGEQGDAPPRPASASGELDDARAALARLPADERRDRIEAALVRLRSDVREERATDAWRLRLRPSDAACRDAMIASAPDDFVLTADGLVLAPGSEQARARWLARGAYIEIPRVDRFARVELDLLALPGPLAGIELFADDEAAAGGAPIAHAHVGQGVAFAGGGAIPERFFEVGLQQQGRGAHPHAVSIDLGNEAVTVRSFSDPAPLPIGRLAGPLRLRVYLAPGVPLHGIRLTTLKSSRPGDPRPEQARATDVTDAPDAVGINFGQRFRYGEVEILETATQPRRDGIALVESGRSEVRMRFRIERRPALALLCIEHTATMTKGLGYDPIDVTVNGRPVAFDLEPTSPQWQWERFCVTDLLVEGENEVVLGLGPASSHHWLRQLELRTRD